MQIPEYNRYENNGIGKYAAQYNEGYGYGYGIGYGRYSDKIGGQGDLFKVHVFFVCLSEIETFLLLILDADS